MRKQRTLLIGFVALKLDYGNSFLMHRSRINPMNTLYQSTKPQELKTSRYEKDKQTEILKQVQELETQAAILSLQRLLDKQKADILETEQLLKAMEDSSHQTFNIAGTQLSHQPTIFINDTRTASIMAAADYGFKSRSEGGTTKLTGGAVAGEPFPGYGPPGNVWDLGWQQFFRNLKAMRGEYEEDNKEEKSVLSPKQLELQSKLEQLTLNTTAIWVREESDRDGPAANAPLLVRIPYYVLCVFLDKVFEGRYVPARFFFLETVARMPYFSYITMLHTYETLGFWRRSAGVKRIHFAEEWNEFHHLLIMESLGGDQRWWVRFLAQHSAIAYYFALVALFAISPSSSYKFSEMLETHAVHTYSQLLEENEKLLKSLPPPIRAVEYYTIGASDPLFSEYQTSGPKSGMSDAVRRPGKDMQNLFDVFTAILDDEGDHVNTMQACLDPTVAVRSPAMEKNFLTGLALTAATASLVGSGAVDLSSLVDTLSGGGALQSATDAVDVAEVASVGSSIIDGILAAVAGVAAAGSQLIKEGELGAVEGEAGIMEIFRAIISRLR